MHTYIYIYIYIYIHTHISIHIHTPACSNLCVEGIVSHHLDGDSRCPATGEVKTWLE